MTKHYLKTLAPYFDAVKAGYKTFEVRKNDRGFQPGDEVVLMRTTGKYIDDCDIERRAMRGDADTLKFSIGWMLTGGQFGIEPGYVVFSLDPLEEKENG